MSADNYFHIRKEGGQFVVSKGFMSDDYAPGRPPDHPCDRRFPTLEEAEDYAFGEDAEYGVHGLERREMTNEQAFADAVDKTHATNEEGRIIWHAAIAWERARLRAGLANERLVNLEGLTGADGRDEDWWAGRARGLDFALELINQPELAK